MSDTLTVAEIVERLRQLARPNALEGMARFGIATERALGVSMPDLRAMSKSLGRNHGLALELWRTPLRETRILPSLIADPQQMTGGGRRGCARLRSARWAALRLVVSCSRCRESGMLRVPQTRANF